MLRLDNVQIASFFSLGFLEYLDDRVELERIYFALNKCVTPSRQHAAAVIQNDYMIDCVKLKVSHLKIVDKSGTAYCRKDLDQCEHSL